MGNMEIFPEYYAINNIINEENEDITPNKVKSIKLDYFSFQLSRLIRREVSYSDVEKIKKYIESNSINVDDLNTGRYPYILDRDITFYDKIEIKNRLCKDIDISRYTTTIHYLFSQFISFIKNSKDYHESITYKPIILKILAFLDIVRCVE